MVLTIARIEKPRGGELGPTQPLVDAETPAPPPERTGIAGVALGIVSLGPEFPAGDSESAYGRILVDPEAKDLDSLHSNYVGTLLGGHMIYWDRRNPDIVNLRNSARTRFLEDRLDRMYHQGQELRAELIELDIPEKQANQVLRDCNLPVTPPIQNPHLEDFDWILAEREAAWKAAHPPKPPVKEKELPIDHEKVRALQNEIIVIDPKAAEDSDVAVLARALKTHVNEAVSAREKAREAWNLKLNGRDETTAIIDMGFEWMKQAKGGPSPLENAKGPESDYMNVPIGYIKAGGKVYRDIVVWYRRPKLNAEQSRSTDENEGSNVPLPYPLDADAATLRAAVALRLEERSTRLSNTTELPETEADAETTPVPTGPAAEGRAFAEAMAKLNPQGKVSAKFFSGW